MPDFTIIAGPNGAGKSSFSRLLSSQEALIFDADKVKALREKQYPDVPVESIEMMLTTAYWEVEEIAIERKIDLTVESNLRDDFLITRAAYFKEKGYSINLIFMLLPNVETSQERVDLRISTKGHFVDLESIKYNFEYSLKMLLQHYEKFDSLSLYDSSLQNDITIPTPMLLLKNNTIQFIESNTPFWAKTVISEITQKLKTK